MNKADVLFLDIYKSIRGDWSGGISNRGKTMLELLGKTTLPEELKIWFPPHLEEMLKEWENSNDYFDGRSWARDTTNSYDDLMEDKTWFDKEFYEEHSIYEKDVEEFYQRFPLFTSKNYLVNHFMPQLMGKKPNTKALDSHSSADEKITKENLEKFLSELKV